MLHALIRRASQVSEAARVALAGAAGALLFVVTAPFSNFSPAGYIDPWLYTGYFLHFRYVLRHIGFTYYVSRLPWILPGLAVFQAAPPEAASLILNAALVAVSAISLYWIVRWTYGPFPAVLSAIALATNPYFISTVAWDYPDGPAIAYLFAAVAVALRPRGNRAVNGVTAGVLLALAGHTNMAAGPAILGALAIPWWRWRHSWRELWREGVYLAAGVGGATLALCGVSRVLLHRWTFFVGQIGQTLYAIQHPTYLSDMWGTGNGFLVSAYRLFPVALLLVLGGWRLAARRKAAAPLTSNYLFLAVACALYSFEEFVVHGVALRVAYHSSYLVTPVFCFGGLLLGEWWTTGGPASRTARTVAAVFAIAPLYLFAAWRPALPTGRSWALLGALGVATAAAALGGRRRYAACALLVALFAGPALDPHIGYPWSADNTRTFRALMEVERLCRSAIPEERRLRMWYDRDEPLRSVFVSTAAIYVIGDDDLTGALRRGDDAEIKGVFTETTTLAHLTSDPGKLAERRRLLANRGIQVSAERSWEVRSGSAPFYLILQDVIGPAPR